MTCRDPSQRIAQRQPLRADAGAHAVFRPLSATHKFIGSASSPRFAYLLARELADSFTLNVVKRQAFAHQHPDQRRNFYGRIPAVDVVRRIGLGHPDLLRLSECSITTQPLFHARKNYVRRGVQNAVETTQMNAGQTVAEE